MILLDTTILMYASGSPHPLRAPCLKLLLAHRDGLVQASTTIEVIQEFAHVFARRRSRSDATNLARDYAAAFPLLVTEPDDLVHGLLLFEQIPSLGAFDAVLAAVALNRQAEALISADRAFGLVPHLNGVDPASPAMNALLDS